MLEFFTKLLLVARSRLKSRARLEAKNLVLRQQVIVLSRKSPSRVRLCLPKTLSEMTRGCAYDNEAADGRVHEPAAACYPVAVHAASEA